MLLLKYTVPICSKFTLQFPLLKCVFSHCDEFSSVTIKTHCKDIITTAGQKDRMRMGNVPYKNVDIFNTADICLLLSALNNAVNTI